MIRIESNLLNVSRNITCMDTRCVSTSPIKPELEVEDFKSENVPIETTNFKISEDTKSDSNLFLQLENQETIKNGLLFSQPGYKSSTSFSTQNKAQLKTEPINDIVKMEGIVCHEWTIKNEELDIKEEDVEQEATRIPTSLSTPNEAQLKSEPIDDVEKMEGIVYEEWRIKNEELDIKEEDLEQKGNSVVESRVKHTTQTENFETENVPCDQPTFRKDYLRTEDVRKFKCPECDYRTPRKRNLKAHMMRHINSEKAKKYKCNDCDYQAFQKSHLKIHMLRHMNPEEVNKFKCGQCKFKTMYNSSFKAHLLLHVNSEDVKKYKCNYCDYRSSRKCYLKRHMMQHINSEDVKKFKCNDCDYRASRKDYLKTHMMRHVNSEDVKKFKCNDCDYRSFRKCHLKVHMLRHMNSEEIRFKCGQCKFVTIYKKNLKLHSLRHIKPEDLKQHSFQT